MDNPKRSVMTAVIAVALLAGPAVTATAAVRGTPRVVTASSRTTARLAAAPTARPAAVSRPGGERFVLTARRVGARREQVVAAGVLKARGYAVTGRLRSGRAVAWLVFRHGSVRLATAVTRSWVSVPNLRTCSFSEIYHGRYRLHGGTRRYAGAAGAGRFVTTITGRLARRHGDCSSRLASLQTSTVTSGSIRW